MLAAAAGLEAKAVLPHVRLSPAIPARFVVPVARLLAPQEHGPPAATASRLAGDTVGWAGVHGWVVGGWVILSDGHAAGPLVDGGTRGQSCGDEG